MKILILLSLFFVLESHASSNYDNLHKKIAKVIKGSSFIKRFTLGKNDEGSILYGYEYSSDSKTKKVNHLVVATHHGNEGLSAELAYEFIKSLSSKKDAFKGARIFIIPVLNKSGYDKGEREEVASGVSHDPNRDYPDPCVEKKSFKLKSTTLLSGFVKEKNIVGAITIHGYYGSLTYPWGIYTDNYRSLDHDIFELKAQKATRHNSYTTGTHADVLYPAGGAFEDWAYFEHGVWSLLVELENRPDFKNDVKMLYSSIESFPGKRSSDHRHIGNCTEFKDLGISRP
ncbi:MAG: hypothetical protein ACJAT2_000357 [Bacteriovoracaceae bacterium]|jgi:hypothetical protein